MDARHYEQIVDKLMIFRGKIPRYGDVNDIAAKDAVYELTRRIDKLLREIDNYAEKDALGWIK